MSAEAARIISKISGRKENDGTGIMLGTVKSVSPLTVKFDDIAFDVSSLMVNSLLLSHSRTGDITSLATHLLDAKMQFDGCLATGDRVAGAAVGGYLYIVLCKVVKT